VLSILYLIFFNMLSIRISSIKNTFLSVISEEDYRIIYTGIEYVPNTRLIKITIHTSPKSKFSTKLRLLTGHRHFRQKIFNYRNTQINDFTITPWSRSMKPLWLSFFKYTYRTPNIWMYSIYKCFDEFITKVVQWIAVLKEYI
jgi:hypothetical protein